MMSSAKLKEDYNKFLERAPEVFPLFERLSSDMRDTGRKTYSAKAIVEVIRWEHDLKSTNLNSFKMNNNYTALMVRDLIAKDHTFNGFFQLRRSKLDE